MKKLTDNACHLHAEFETDGDSISTFLVKTVSELAPTLPKRFEIFPHCSLLKSFLW